MSHSKRTLFSLCLAMTLLCGCGLGGTSPDIQESPTARGASPVPSETTPQVAETAKPNETEEPMISPATDKAAESIRVLILLSSPSVSEKMGGQDLKTMMKDPDALAYREALLAEQEEIIARMEETLGTELDVAQRLTWNVNAISAWVLPGDMAKLEAVEGVRGVTGETQNELQGAPSAPAVVDGRADS